MATRKKIQIDINLDSKKSIKSLNQIESELDVLKNKLKETTDPEEFNKLAVAVKKAEGQFKTLNQSFEGLSGEDVAGKLGQIAGGLGSVATAITTVSAGNEDIEKFFKTFATGLAITNAVKGGIEAFAGAQKLLKNSTVAVAVATRLQTISTVALATAQKILSFGITGTSKSLKILKFSLASTGIGLLVVAIGLLIANFDKVKTAIGAVVDFIADFFKPVIDLVIDALQFLGIVASDEAQAEEEASEKVIEAMQARQEEIQKLLTANQNLADARQRQLDFEISKLKILGEDTTNFERKRIKEAIEASIIRNKLLEEQLRNQIKLDIAKAKSGDIDEEEADKLIASQKEQFEAIKSTTIQTVELRRSLTLFNLEANQKEIKDDEKASDERKKIREKSFQDELKLLQQQAKQLADFRKIQEDIRIAGIENSFERSEAVVNRQFNQRIDDLRNKGLLTIQLQTELEFQRISALRALDKKQEDEKEKIAQEALQREIDREDAQFALLQELRNTEKEQEIADLVAEFDQKFALAQNNVELEVALKEDLEARLKVINDNAKEEEVESAKETQERINAIRDEGLNFASNALNSLSNLNNILADIAINKAEGDEDKQQAIRKKSFERNKKIQIGLATIQGIQGVINALTASSIIPEPFATIARVINAGAVAVATGANIAKIKSTNFEGGGGGASVSTGGLAGGATTASTPALQGGGFAQQDLQGQQAEVIGGGAGAIQPIRAFVVERDISSAQAELFAIQEQSEIE